MRGQHAVHRSAVEQHVLREHVVEADRLAQPHIVLRLGQREARAVEAHEKVHNRPLLNRLLEHAVAPKHHNPQVVVPPQPAQHRFHRLAEQLHVHAAHPQSHHHHAHTSLLVSVFHLLLLLLFLKGLFRVLTNALTSPRTHTPTVHQHSQSVQKQQQISTKKTQRPSFPFPRFFSCPIMLSFFFLTQLLFFFCE